MKKSIRVSSTVSAWHLPSEFLAKCMANAERQPHTADIEFHDYLHSSGNRVFVGVFEQEILIVTEEEANSGKWLHLGERQTWGIADVEKYWRYIG